MKPKINPTAALFALIISGVMVITTSHDESEPVNPCGHVVSILKDGFDVSFKYQTESLPPSVSLRFNTDRPDTVAMNQLFCLKK